MPRSGLAKKLGARHATVFACQSGQAPDERGPLVRGRGQRGQVLADEVEGLGVIRLAGDPASEHLGALAEEVPDRQDAIDQLHHRPRRERSEGARRKLHPHHAPRALEPSHENAACQRRAP